MDLKLFNILKSMEKLEKDHNFQSDSDEIPIVELKYPHNVITVASPTGKAPPPSPGERRFTKLSEAIYTAIHMALDGISNSCSILVHEGIYIDAFDIEKQPIGCGLELQIIGFKNVRLILQESLGIAVFASDFTLNNILIYDFRLNRQSPTIGILDGSQVELIKVRIYAPGSLAIKLLQKSKLSLEESGIFECYEAVYSEDSDLRLKNCTLGGLLPIGIGVNFMHMVRSTFEANGTTFSYCSSSTCVQLLNTRASIEDCILKAIPKPSESHLSSCSAIRGYNGSSILLKRSSISNFREGALSSGFDSRIIAENCVISDCAVCFTFMFNSHGLIKNCKLLGGHVAVVSNNVKGTINFQNNQVKDQMIASIVKDTKSVQPHHDFENIQFRGKDNILREFPSDREQSANTKKMQELLKAAEAGGSRYYSSEPGLGGGKFCSKCKRGEIPNSEKMKFCVKCRKVCYCSKECQKADWSDHKLACQSL